MATASTICSLMVKWFASPMYAPMDELPWSDELPPESFIRNLQDQLIVTIDSPSARPGMYYIGKFALMSGELLENLQIGIDNKSDMDLPIINTLAQVAAVAVQRAYDEAKGVPSEPIEVTADMATALPVTQAYR